MKAIDARSFCLVVSVAFMVCGCSKATPTAPQKPGATRVDPAKAELQLVKRHGLVLPQGEGYDEFEVYIPPTKQRWLYLIAANDEHCGPLTGHLLIESRRVLSDDRSSVRWHVRVWRYGNVRTNVAGELVCEANGRVPLPANRNVRQVFVGLSDKSTQVIAFGEANAPTMWSLYLHPSANATSEELRR